MDEAQVITKTISDGSVVAIKLERIAAGTVRFTVAKDYTLVDQMNDSTEEDIRSTSHLLQLQYFGKIIDRGVRV